MRLMSFNLTTKRFIYLSLASLSLLFTYLIRLNGIVRADAQTIPAAIASDCSVDVTAELLAWIASVPDGSTLEFGQDACYRIDGRLLILNRHNLVFAGNNATFKAVTDGRELNDTDARTRAHWSVRRSSNITFKDMTIQGSNPYAGTQEEAYVAALEAQHGIELGSVQGGLIDNVKIYDVYGDFVYFGGNSTLGTLTSNFTVRNSHFERNGRQGMAFTGAEDILIENNYIGQVRRTTFDIEPNFSNGHVRRITIDKNTLGPKRLGLLSANGAGSIVEDITFSSNNLKGTGLSASIGATPTTRRSRIKIINNTSDTGSGNSGGSAFYFTRVDDVEVSGNTMQVQYGRGMSAVQVYGSAKARIFNNTFLNVNETLRESNDAYGNQSTDNYACGNRIVSTDGFTDPLACMPAEVRIDNPLDGASLSDTIKIEASVNDQIGIKQVEFYVDGVLKETDSEVPYEYAWDTKTVEDNSSHTIEAVAVDLAGMHGSHEIVTTVNNSLAESWTNTDGSAWPARWVFEGAVDEVRTLDILNNEGRIIHKPGATGRVLAYMNDRAATNLDQTVKFRVSSNNAGVGLLARRSDADPDTYYYAVAGAATPLRIRKVVGGVAKDVGYTSRPMVSNVDYKIRFVVESDPTDSSKTSLKVKVWEANTEEPVAYNLTKIDAEPRLQGLEGRFGLTFGLSNSRQVWVDDYSATLLP